MSRILSCVSAFAAFLMLLSIASAGDLKQIRDAQRLAVEKLNQDVTSAIEASYKQAPTDAKFSLLRVMDRVKNSADIVDTEQKKLVSRLLNRLSTVEDSIRRKNVTQDPVPPREPSKYRPPVNEPGKGVSGLAKNTIDGRKDTTKTYNDLERDRAKGIQGLNEGIEKSAVLTDKEITLPKDWADRQARRVNQKLTDQEVKVLKALNSTMSIDYDDEFKSVLNHIMDKTGLTIIVDEASMQEANVDYKDKVTLKFPKLNVRTALKKILGDKGLTYIIKEGNIQVMTPKKASEYTVVRTYQIDDLTAPDPMIQRMFGPFVAQAQKYRNAQAIIGLIQGSIEPSYWQPNGPGTITFEPLTGALIVRASAEMHYQLGSPGLFGGR
jgi:hypothetical protein